MAVSLPAVPAARAWTSSRRSMPARCGCTCAPRRARASSRRRQYFAQVEAAIRQLVGNDQIDVDARQHRPALQRHQHRPERFGHRRARWTAKSSSRSRKSTRRPRSTWPHLRRELPQRFPELQFFFQPADIVDQVLNFGQPAPIDIRVSGPDNASGLRAGRRSSRAICAAFPGVVDAHVFQVPDAPALAVDVDRALADADGHAASATAASNVLVTTNASAQTAPNFWVDPSNGVSYPLVVQLPTYKINSPQDLWSMPLTAQTARRASASCLMNVAKFGRGTDAAGAVAAQHPARLRRQCRRAGPRSGLAPRRPSTR